MRMLGRFSKTGNVRYISHLDMMRTMQRVFRRANISIRYSQGFNPHSILSFATALSVGFESEAEWFDLGLNEEMSEDEFYKVVSKEMPPCMQLFEAHAVDDHYPALMSIASQATYRIELISANKWDLETIRTETKEMLEKPILIQKVAKSKNRRQPPKIKETDIAPLIQSIDFDEDAQGHIIMNFVCTHAQSGSLNPRVFIRYWKEKLEITTIDERICKTDMRAQQDANQIDLYAFQIEERL